VLVSVYFIQLVSFYFDAIQLSIATAFPYFCIPVNQAHISK